MLVRVPDRSGGNVQRVLAAGADGLLVPQVAERQTAEAVGAQMTFSRDGGVRGMGSKSRAGRWGLRPASEYLSRNIVRAIQLEELAALERAEQLLDAPGVNAAFIGYSDLGLSSGLTAEDPKLQALTRKVVDAARQRSMPIGTAVGTAPAAASAAAQGFTYVLVSNDASLLASGAQRLTDPRRGWATVARHHVVADRRRVEDGSLGDRQFGQHAVGVGETLLAERVEVRRNRHRSLTLPTTTSLW